MSAEGAGALAGAVLFSLLVPAILMIVLKLIPATKHKHGLVYGLCGAIAVATPLISASGPVWPASGILAALFIFGYLRARKSPGASKA